LSRLPAHSLPFEGVVALSKQGLLFAYLPGGFTGFNQKSLPLREVEDKLRK
jgi:hypothetical protein